MNIESMYLKNFAENQKAMAASIQSLEYCRSVINEYKLSTVLDAGSGLSSFFFHHHFKNVTTIDDNEQWANKTKEVIKKELNLDIPIKQIDCLNDKVFDFVFYDYGDIETRIFFFKQALKLCRYVMYIDDIHIDFYRGYIESRCKNLKLVYIPQSIDEFGRYGAILIKKMK